MVLPRELREHCESSWLWLDVFLVSTHFGSVEEMGCPCTPSFDLVGLSWADAWGMAPLRRRRDHLCLPLSCLPVPRDSQLSSSLPLEMAVLGLDGGTCCSLSSEEGTVGPFSSLLMCSGTYFGLVPEASGRRTHG